MQICWRQAHVFPYLLCPILRPVLGMWRILKNMFWISVYQWNKHRERVVNIYVHFLSVQLFSSTTKSISQIFDLGQKENVMLELRGTRPLLCNNQYNTSKSKRFLIYHSTDRDTSIEKNKNGCRGILAWDRGSCLPFPIDWYSESFKLCSLLPQSSLPPKFLISQVPDILGFDDPLFYSRT